MKTAPITVVIPAYNAEPFIADAIRSALAQTLPVAEIIVVDDGSTDNTAAVARSLGANVLSRSSGGPSAARNAGIRGAAHPWIAFLDADDLWEPEKIETQWTALQLCPEAKMICSDFCKFKDRQPVVASFLNLPEVGYARLNKTEIKEKISLLRVGEDFWGVGQFIFPSTVIINRELLVSVGLFDESIPSTEDVECFLRVLALTPLIVVEQTLMRYRIHDKNSSINQLKMIESYILIAEQMIERADRYPPGAAKAWSNLLPAKLAEAGRLKLEAGQPREARSLLAQSLKKRWSVRTGGLWFATWTNPSALNHLLSLKRFLTPG